MVTRYHVKNLDCPDCALKIEGHLQRIEGISSAEVNYATLTLTVDTEFPERVRAEVRAVEPQVELIPLTSSTVNEFADEHKEFRFGLSMVLMIVSVALFLTVVFFNGYFQKTSVGIAVEYVLGMAAYFLAGWNVLTSAFRTVRRGDLFDENVLMTIATVGAIAIGALSEAIGVMIFYKVGEFLQNLALHRSRNSIRSLLAVRPNLAHVLHDGVQTDIPPDEVSVGEKVMVRPGEKIPLDGVVISGSSSVDASALTGEPKPYSASTGDSVLAGEINVSALLTIQVSKLFSQSSIVKLLELVENASARKAKTEKFISRIARYYTPFVVAAATLLALVPPIFFGQPFSVWIYRALVLLVISCPCALVISIPLGFFGGIGGASRRGILVKGAHFLERLASVRTVVFDKTGTLTKGVFNVNKVVPQAGISETELIEFATAAEYYSNHPIAVSIREKARKEGVVVDHADIGEHNDIAGVGVKVNYRGKIVSVGNVRMMQQEGIDISAPHEGGSIVNVSVDKRYCGYILVGDEIKPDSVEAIRMLKREGVEQVWMLTGDNADAAHAVAAELGIDHFEASLLPGQKVEHFERILNASSGNVAFVGDGVNDAPVLARSDVGIAMGTLGSDAAIETADVVISGDSPLKVAEAIKVGRTTRSIVWQNIILAIAVKLLFVVFGAMGMASMWEAVFADMGMAVIAVINAGRALGGRS